jgi:hypothetical protein
VNQKSKSLFEIGGEWGYTWDMNKNQMYPIDLTNGQWGCIKELIPAAKSAGRPRALDMRKVVNAILYLSMVELMGKLPSVCMPVRPFTCMHNICQSSYALCAFGRMLEGGYLDRVCLV